VITQCLCCSSEEIILIQKYPTSPLTDNYQDTSVQSLSLPFYPLNLYLCRLCGHLQLGHHVSAIQSYQDYKYNSSLTLGLNQSFIDYADELKSYINNENNSEKLTLLDVGSNDGSFIAACREKGIKAVGIEPSLNQVNLANKNNRTTLQGYFDQTLTEKLRTSGLEETFTCISFNNVFANLPSPYQSLLLAKSLISKDGVIVIQTGYHPIQFTHSLFDYVYHEHYSYFSISSLSTLAKSVGLQLSKYSLSSLRGGTLRAFFKSSKDSISQLKVYNERFCNERELNGLYALIDSSRLYLQEFLNHAKQQNKKIIGYGASHSTGILVHTLSLFKYLDYLVDDNKLKHGCYMPGTDLVVKPSDQNINSCDVIVILAWQYFDQIRHRLLSLGFQGEIIKPILP